MGVPVDGDGCDRDVVSDERGRNGPGLSSWSQFTFARKLRIPIDVWDQLSSLRFNQSIYFDQSWQVSQRMAIQPSQLPDVSVCCGANTLAVIPATSSEEQQTTDRSAVDLLFANRRICSVDSAMVSSAGWSGHCLNSSLTGRIHSNIQPILN